MKDTYIKELESSLEVAWVSYEVAVFVCNNGRAMTKVECSDLIDKTKLRLSDMKSKHGVI